MPGQPTPPLIVEPFGKNAGGSFIQNPIPLTTSSPGRASFDQGFPALTMTPEVAGGVPPYGQDVNGILYMVTAHIAALQAGQPYLYSATLSTAMGGYAVGTILGMADGTGLWINQTSGNTTDPDGGSAAGWLPVYRYGYTALTGLTGGSRTLTAAEARSGVITLAGTLAGNQTIVLPNTLQTWLIVNNTSGAFTTTVKTAAGTGVVVPQGGYGAPVQVYGEGTNIYPTVAPLTIPTSVSPTANTYVLRDNLGNVYAAALNQNTGYETPTIGALFVENAAHDGFLRKVHLTDVEAQLLLENMGGHVQAVQMSAGASAANFTPTVGPFATPGYCKLPNGLIFQWGSSGSIPAISTAHQTFPLAFPIACLNIQITATGGAGTAQSHDLAASKNATGFNLTNDASVASTFDWFAIGY
jgi:hypothetical protein